jgi:hypothetical protein
MNIDMKVLTKIEGNFNGWHVIVWYHNKACIQLKLLLVFKKLLYKILIMVQGDWHK